MDLDSLIEHVSDPIQQAILKELRSLREDVRPIKEDMSTLRDIIRAWEAASWFGRAIKWLGGIGATIAGLYAFAKGYTTTP